MLKDKEKFKGVDCDPEKELNFVLAREREVTDVLKKLLKKGSLSEETYNKLRPVGTRLGILYGLCKVHKASVNGSPPFRPILNAINTPTYKLAKYLVPLLSSLTTNEYTVSDSFTFAEEISKQNAQYFMASLDINSLFTNIPLDETVKICVDSLYSETDCISGLSKDEFSELLSLATNQSYFKFNGQFFRQVDGVAMGSPLGPCLANAFLCHHEKTWLNDCPSEFKPIYYRRYVDDIFVLFSSPDHLASFQEYLNKKHANISFTSESEENGRLPFLDVSVSREKDRFVTNVYRKPTFSGVFSNFTSFLPDRYKIGLICTLLFRIFRISSDFSKFHVETKRLKDILLRNGYPSSLIDRLTRTFLSKVFQVKNVVSTVPKQELCIFLPFLGPQSLRLRSRLQNYVNSCLPTCDLRIVFKCETRLSSFFRYKDRVKKALRSMVVYRFKCDGCNSVYIGKSIRHLSVRVAEHVGVSALTGKDISTQPSAICDHLRFTECGASRHSLDEFAILASASNNYALEIKESLMIHRDKPLLNANIASTQLYLFDNNQ